ncbi:MAG TPA: hypothetical protein VJ986_09255 [Gaiellaceae bacterium]|nr:hypothetical protein [Gaiellaceae bacterium]
MAYLITHFFEGGTESQYQAVIAAAHPPQGLPAGQTFHAAGPTEGGWLVAALWDSKEACDTFVGQTLLPALQTTEGAFAGPPQERSCEVVNVITA